MVVHSAAKVKHIFEKRNKFDGIGLCPNPGGIFHDSPVIDLKILEPLIHSSVLSSDNFTLDMLIELCKVAAHLQQQNFLANDVLQNKIMAAAFFEASTRTRLSFESAMLKLGGKTLSVADAANTGIAKGESLLDIGQMFNSYADIIVVRHTEQKAVQELSRYLQVPLINGGNGSDEHPTQALADWYALLKWKPFLAYGELAEHERLHIGIIGTPGNMRSVKSFFLMSLLFKNCLRKITIISEMADPLGPEIKSFYDSSPVPLEFSHNLQEVIMDVDVFYMNAIAYLGDGYRRCGSHFKLNAHSKLKKNSVILHPLARGTELDTNLDNTKHNLYFNQADGAVFVREALLLAIFDKLKDILPTNLIRK